MQHDVIFCNAALNQTPNIVIFVTPPLFRGTDLFAFNSISGMCQPQHPMSVD